MSEILWWNLATACRGRCIWKCTQNCPTTNQKWYKLTKRQSTRQLHTQTNHICKQEPARNIEREALSMLHWLKMFHHYCLMRGMSIITDYNLLVAIFKKYVAMLSQKIQWVLLRLHQYSVKVTYKPGPDLFIADWLSRENHKESKDKGYTWHAIECWCQKYLACNWMLMPYRQLQTSQISWWYSIYNKKPHKMITYTSWKIISTEAGQRTKIKFNMWMFNDRGKQQHNYSITQQIKR